MEKLGVTFVLKTELLQLCMPEQFFETEKMKLADTNHSWWIRCYPNGLIPTYEKHVSLVVCTSYSGLELAATATIVDTDVRETDTNRLKPSDNCAFQKLVSHEKLMESEKESFDIQVTIRLKHSSNTNTNDVDVSIRCVGEALKKEIPGCNCTVELYPSGAESNIKGYASVYFKFPRYVVNEVSCAISINGVLITRGVDILQGFYFKNFEKCFSHEQINNADHVDNIVSLKCTAVTYSTSDIESPGSDLNERNEQPVRRPRVILPSDDEIPDSDSTESTEEVELPSPVQASSPSTAVHPGTHLNRTSRATTPANSAAETRKSITFEVQNLKSQYTHFTKQPVTNWRITGHTKNIRGGNYISFYVETKTTETTGTVIMNGVIKIKGISAERFEKKFKAIVEEETCLAFVELISHKELKEMKDKNDKVTFTCDVRFKTIDSFHCTI